MSTELLADDPFKPTKAELQAVEDWKRKWPDYCRGCDGWGGHSSPGTMYEPPGVDACEELDFNWCHRCGEFGLNDEAEGPCSECGWKYDDGVPGY